MSKNVVKTDVKNKQGKMIGLSKERVKALGRSVFDEGRGSNGSENTKRHNEYMDMMGKAYGFTKVNQVTWTDNIVAAIGKDKTQRIIEEAIMDLSSDKAIKSLTNEKNLVFYKNAMGYFRNKYGAKKNPGRRLS